MSPSCEADTYLDILISNSIPGSEQYLMFMAIKNKMEEIKK